MVRKTSGRNSQSLETGGCSAAVEKCQGTYYLAFTPKQHSGFEKFNFEEGLWDE